MDASDRILSSVGHGFLLLQPPLTSINLIQRFGEPTESHFGYWRGCSRRGWWKTACTKAEAPFAHSILLPQVMGTESHTGPSSDPNVLKRGKYKPLQPNSGFNKHPPKFEMI